MKQKDEVAKMKEINYKAISNKIRRKRVSMGLTQEYLATAADVNVSHISNIENCHSKVSVSYTHLKIMAIFVIRIIIPHIQI